MSTRTIRLATRGSDLALRQAAIVEEALAGRSREVELVEVETRGDQIRDELIHRLGKTGAFVRALDERVLAGDVDGAVHSMKDMPTDQPSDLVVAGVPQRAPAGDVLVAPDGVTLEELPECTVVGTSSLRRQAQLLAERPDLAVEGLRGNVDTRVRKLLAPRLQREHERRLAAAEGREDVGGETDDDTDGADADADAAASDEGEPAHGYDRTPQEWFDDLAEIERLALERAVDTEYDAIVLARAGLERAGLLHALEYRSLDPERFVPAPGQGALAVTALDGEMGDLLHEVLDHPRTRVETTAERTVLAELGGGCVAPVGVHAVIRGDQVHVTARVLDRDGEEEVSMTRDLPVESHAAAAREFAAELADSGAADLVEQARRRADEETEAKREE